MRLENSFGDPQFLLICLKSVASFSANTATNFAAFDAISPEVPRVYASHRKAEPMSKSDDLRKQAKEAGERGDKTKSLKEGAAEHKREKSLNDMADNEDWLDGKPKAKAKNLCPGPQR